MICYMGANDGPEIAEKLRGVTIGNGNYWS
jgi:hypothetical protein